MILKEFETISEYVCKQTRWTDGSIRHDRMEDVVRCKDCIVFGTHGKNTDICPMWHNTHIDPYRDFCSRGVRKTENSSEKPNNSKDEPQTNADQHVQDVESVGSVDHKTEPTCSKMEQVDKDINVRSKDEPQTCSVNGRPYSECGRCEHFKCTADEPQTEICLYCEYYEPKGYCKLKKCSVSPNHKCDEYLVIEPYEVKIISKSHERIDGAKAIIEDEPQTEVTTDCRQTDCPWK